MLRSSGTLLFVTWLKNLWKVQIILTFAKCYKYSSICTTFFSLFWKWKIASFTVDIRRLFLILKVQLECFCCNNRTHQVYGEQTSWSLYCTQFHLPRIHRCHCHPLLPDTFLRYSIPCFSRRLIVLRFKQLSMLAYLILHTIFANFCPSFETIIDVSILNFAYNFCLLLFFVWNNYQCYHT